MSDGVLGLFINPVTLSPTGADLTTLNVKSDQLGFLGGSVVKNLPANAGDTGSIPEPIRSHMPSNKGPAPPLLKPACPKAQAQQREVMATRSTQTAARE